jgi:glycosyltransferase involved in cell wall biosynthesis
MSGRPPAIVQDWLAAEAGSERVTLELARLLPTADLYTSFFDPAIYGGELAGRHVHTWPLQRLLGPTERFRSLLPFYPVWFSMLDLRDRNLVVSSSVAFTHAVRTSRTCVHVAYVHTPLRYAWDLDTYLAGSSSGGLARVGARMLRPFLQRWDRAAAQRPDVLVANSETVRARIQKLWGRDSEVIHPPVDVDSFRVSDADDGYLLVAARLLAYRRIDLAVEACTRLGRQLVVVGDGPERRRLEVLAGPSVRFVGRVDRPILVDLLERCHALLVPGVEDFGIVPVEAMAAGKPVIGRREGGVGETVVDGQTGLLVEESTPEAFVEAIERLDTIAFDRAAIRARAETFGSDVFRARFSDLLSRLGVDRSTYDPSRR